MLRKRTLEAEGGKQKDGRFLCRHPGQWGHCRILKIFSQRRKGGKGQSKKNPPRTLFLHREKIPGKGAVGQKGLEKNVKKEKQGQQKRREVGRSEACNQGKSLKKRSCSSKGGRPKRGAKKTGKKKPKTWKPSSNPPEKRQQSSRRSATCLGRRKNRKVSQWAEKERVLPRTGRVHH